MRTDSSETTPLLLLTQGFAGDRLGACLAPALRAQFPHRPLLGLGGARMAEAGVQLAARTDTLSAIGYSGLLPLLLPGLWALRQTRQQLRRELPAAVIAVDFWQPLALLHRVAPSLTTVPHICYLPPAPNLIGAGRVHAAVARVFHSTLTPFPHQERLFQGAGAAVFRAAHAGLELCRKEATPLPAADRAPVLALLPGSRTLEIRYSLPEQLEAARRISTHHPDLQPVVCCAGREAEALVQRRHPGVRTSLGARATLAEARFALVCSGTAVLEAAVLGCPGVMTYYGSALQRWEWRRFHVPKLEELRRRGIASPYIALPNILHSAGVYPEAIGAAPAVVAELALQQLEDDPESLRAPLDAVTQSLAWNDAGTAVAERVAAALAGE